MYEMEASILTKTLRDNRQKKDWVTSIDLLNTTDVTLYSGSSLRDILDEFFIALFYNHDTNQATELLSHFERTYVDEHIVDNTDFIFSHIRQNKKVIATCDLSRRPGDNEIIICYGNFPLDYHHLVHCNPIRRHFKYLGKLTHDTFEFDPRWTPVDAIYIINQETRQDRYLETLRELASLRAPLDRIHKAPLIMEKTTTDPKVNEMMAYGKCNLKIVEECIAKNYHHTLVLESTFCFSSTTSVDSIEVFFNKNYDYDVCLLAAGKYGTMKPVDNLLCRLQNDRIISSGFLMSATGARKLKEIWDTGYTALTKTKEEKYSFDRTWCTLSHFFVFRDKLGFQRPCYQVSTGKTVFTMD